MTAKRSVLFVLGLLVAALVLVGAGCGGGDGDGKTLKIVSDLPLQGSDRVQTEQMVAAIQFVLAQQDNKAGDYTIEFESFDDATAAAGKWDEAKCAENGRTYADDDSIVGIIGTYNSGCAAIIIAIANEAGLAMISPANTAVGLTHSGAGTEQGEPEKYYPSGSRNYTRVVASDDFQGKVGAQFMKDELGVTSVYILDDKELYGKGLADEFQAAAEGIGLKVAGHEGWDKDSPNYTALMTKIKSSGADGIYIGGVSTNNGGQLIRDKVAILGPNTGNVKLVVPDGFILSSLFDEAGIEILEGTYGTAPTLPVQNLSGEGAQFVEDFAADQGIDPAEFQVYTAYAASAAQALLDAISRSDGSRADIIAKLFEVDIDTVTGPLTFNAEGDPAGGTEQLFLAQDGAWVWQKGLELTS